MHEVDFDRIETLRARADALAAEYDVTADTLPPLGDPAGDDSAQWPEPQPLPSGLPPVEPFDMALLPTSLRPWAADIAERLQCPPDFVGASAMVALAAVVGRKVGIRPQAHTDWTVVPNLWGVIVGRPGAMKSPAIEAALSPLRRLAARAVEAHEAALTEYRAEAIAAKLRAEAGEKAARRALAQNPRADVAALLAAQEPQPPVLRRYIVTDTNAASLAEVLRQNPNGVLVARDELVSLLTALEREDMAEARGLYLTAWNGDSAYTVDRIGRGLHLHIPAVSVSLLGAAQPGAIAGFVRSALRGGRGDDGLLQRFGMAVWPDQSPEWRHVDRWPDSEAKRQAFAVFERLDALVPEAIGAMRAVSPSGEPEGIPYLRFDTGGQGLFLEWRTDLEKRLRSGELHPAIESHLAKYRKLVPALALLTHLADGGTGAVTERAVLQALAWAEYLESHAARLYASATMPEAQAARAIVARIRKGDLPREFTSWQVWRPGWSGLTDRAQVAEALDLLVELGWLTARKTATGGRPSVAYIVNPRALP